jgi:Fe-S cluster assembly ATP-binding protein
MLNITNLHATVDDKPILKGLTLSVGAGEVHAIMGPNGAGKSTLGYVLGGRPGYEVTQGTVIFDGRDLLDMAPDERAAAGLFLGFQYPVEIPGVSNVSSFAPRSIRSGAPAAKPRFRRATSFA